MDILQIFCLAFGITLLPAALHIYPRRELRPCYKVDDLKEQKLCWYYLMRSIALFALAFFLILYAGASLVQAHANGLIHLLGQGKNSATLITLMLGLLGLVMTIVTIGLASTSEKTISRIDEHRRTMQEQDEKFKDDIKKAEKDREEAITRLQEINRRLELEVKRATLLYLCNKELERLSLSYGEHDPRYLFRNSLVTAYGNNRPEDVLRLLEKYHDESAQVYLLEEEKAYLRLLESWYRERDERIYQETLKAQFDAIDNEFVFRSTEQETA